MATVAISDLLTGSSTPLLASGDIVPFVDISDSTQSPSGSTVKATLTQFFAAIPVPIVVASASANALAVGLNGATNPAFAVDASTALQVAGLKVTGAVTGGTVALVATDSGAAANVTLNAKGTGTIGIGSVSTGRVTITPVTTITGLLTLTAGLTGAVPFAGLATFNAGATIASGQTLTVTGATITGLTAASVATGTFPGVYTVTGALTLSAALTYGGVTLSNAVTGTGNMVLSASPTFTGTVTTAAISATTGTFSGTVQVSTLLQFAGATSSFPALKRATTRILFRLADDSAYCGVETGTLEVTGLLTAQAGITVASGQTITLTGATVAGTPTWSSSQAITLSTAAQPNITSVGTLTGLTMGGTLTMGANTLALASATVSGTPTWSSSQAITLSTASQPNITTLGGLTSVSTLVGFGGTTSSFPALQRSSATLRVMLADASDFANLSCKAFATDGSITVGNSGISGVFTGAAAGSVCITSTTAPSDTPTGGGVLWVEGGALKYKGTSGTVTTVAVA